MVERIVETFSNVFPDRMEEVVFILGKDFPQSINDELTEICEQHDLVPRFGVQEQKLGTAHAVYCAGEYLSGECISVFADTLFSMGGDVDLEGADGVAWVKHVDDPSRFGVVVRENGRITDFVEKPAEPISHEAVIGIYYIRRGEDLKEKIEYLLENDIKGKGGEYQLTDAMDRMLKEGNVFKTASVSEWLDCGTIPALKNSTREYLDREGRRSDDAEVVDSVIREPVYLGPGVRVEQSVVGPYTSIEEGAQVSNSVVQNSILFEESRVEKVVLEDSLIGRHAAIHDQEQIVNIGDHSELGLR
jgi:glucose-1-phosphate thymidylyltransferase